MAPPAPRCAECDRLKRLDVAAKTHAGDGDDSAECLGDLWTLIAKERRAHRRTHKGAN